MNVSAPMKRRPLFGVTSHHRQRYRDQLQAERRRKIRDFAELIANGWNQTAAARAVGVSQQSGNGYFTQMKDELGAQALTGGAPGWRCGVPGCPCGGKP